MVTVRAGLSLNPGEKQRLSKERRSERKLAQYAGEIYCPFISRAHCIACQ
jgi:hypothetical protein